jgi:hypothetical protein
VVENCGRYARGTAREQSKSSRRENHTSADEKRCDQKHQRFIDVAAA